MSADVILESRPAQTPKQDRAAAKGDKKAAKQAELDAKLARYAQLRANVRRRRVGYVLFLLLGIATFAATIWDIIYNESDFEWYLLPVYAVLIVLAILFLISRRRHLEEINEIRALERAWLECEACNSVFQFGSESFMTRKHVGFTCPVCGDESALPLPGANPVERALPAGRLEESNYLCGNCKEDIVVGTYGFRPKAITFRACPKCGVPGKIVSHNVTT